MTIAIEILLLIAALGLIVFVLMQDSDENGMSAISGGAAETFFGKNKAKGLDAKLALITKILAGAFVVLAIVVMFIG